MKKMKEALALLAKPSAKVVAVDCGGTSFDSQLHETWQINVKILKGD